MYRAALLLTLVACGHPDRHAAAPIERPPPRLPAPAPVDVGTPGATYLTAVALQLQPGWRQFLDDCRLRLPVSHPLNDPKLGAVVDLAVDSTGKVVGVSVATSGNADFDRAVYDAVRDAEPFPLPPRDLWSDDDRVHLRWLFARDRRQAGPATANLVEVELPVVEVVERLVRTGDLTRAARRILRAPTSAERSRAIAAVAVAGLREGIASADGVSRRAAVQAIARANVRELLPALRPLLTTTSDAELRLVAIDAAGVLADDASSAALLAQLAIDLVDDPRLARAEARALATMQQQTAVAAIAKAQLDGAKQPNLAALEILAVAPVPQLSGQLAAWAQHGSAQTRAAVCTALAGLPKKAALAALAKGLRDRDASVRATCIATTRAFLPLDATLRARLKELARDRDTSVRAAAIAVVSELAPHSVRASDDAAPEVRAAYAAGLARAEAAVAQAELRLLVEDRDPDVRAAAWRALGTFSIASGQGGLDELATHALADPSASVRLAALGVTTDDAQLVHAASDDDAEVRTSAFVRLAALRGRDASEELLVTRFAAASPGTAERVRTALAWLLAR